MLIKSSISYDYVHLSLHFVNPNKMKLCPRNNFICTFHLLDKDNYSCQSR